MVLWCSSSGPQLRRRLVGLRTCLRLLAGAFVVYALLGHKSHGFAAGKLRVASGLLDSESRGLWRPRPEVGLGLSLAHEGWRGWLGARLLPDEAPSFERTFDDPDRYVFALTRAEGWRFFGPWFVGGGRMEQRPFDFGLHYGNQSFLRGTARMDGVAAGYRQSPVHVQMMVGSPLVAGLVAAYEPDHVKFLASYTFRQDAVTQVPVALAPSRLVWSTRSFDAHEWELAAVTQGRTLRVTGVFQGRHLGLRRFADAANPRTGETPGSADNTLPRSSGEYRALSQVAVLVGEPDDVDGSLWLAVTAGGSASPRYHVGTTDELLRRQGSGSRLFFGLSLEEVWQSVRGQGGVSLESAGEPSYLWLNRRTDSGLLELSRNRLRFWLAVELDL